MTLRSLSVYQTYQTRSHDSNPAPPSFLLATVYLLADDSLTHDRSGGKSLVKWRWRWDGSQSTGWGNV